MNNQFTCRCGHLRKVHRKMVNNTSFVCEVFGPITTVYDCPCYNYKADNLKFLEQKYNESLTTI